MSNNLTFNSGASITAGDTTGTLITTSEIVIENAMVSAYAAIFDNVIMRVGGEFTLSSDTEEVEIFKQDSDGTRWFMNSPTGCKIGTKSNGDKVIMGKGVKSLSEYTRFAR